MRRRDATVSRWYSRAWASKLAAGFTVSSTASGDAAGQADPTTKPPGVIAADLRTGEMLGARIAQLAARMRASA